MIRSFLRVVLHRSYLNLLFRMILCSALTSAGAQVSTANVNGMVEDGSGARIPNVKIKLLNLLTGTENVAFAGNDGAFAVPGVLPGDYSMQVERAGFATIEFSGLTLHVGDLKSFRIRMRIGTLNERIDVDASALTLNTDGASVNSVVGRHFVMNIPLNGRSFQDLISMTPGVIPQSPQVGTPGNFGVNGQRADQNSYLVDGVSANIGPGPLDGNKILPSAGQFAGTTSLGTTQGLVSLDALQEFRALSSSYSAEYGRTPGGQFTLLTRSGTDQLHGSSYAFLRNSYFDASDWFAGFNQRAGHTYFYQQDVGGTLSTPIILPFVRKAPDKPFFFGSYEELHVLQPMAPMVQYVPDSNLRKDAPIQTQALIAGFPSLYNGPSTSGLEPFVSRQESLPSFVKSLDLRLDRKLSERVSAFARFADTRSGSTTRQLSSVSNTTLNSTTLTAGATAQTSARASDEIRFGYATSGSERSTALDPGKEYTVRASGQPTNLAAALGAPAPYENDRAEVYICIPGIGESFINTDQARNTLNQWNFRNTFYWQPVASHLLRLGIDQRRFTSSVHPPPLSITATFLDRAAIVNGRASDLVISRSLPSSPLFNEFSAFVQDEWKAAKTIDISLGVRWDVNPPPGEIHSKNAFTAQGDIQHPGAFTLAPRGTPLWNTDWLAIAPRVGAAWSINESPGKELVVRAGAGMFFDSANRAAVGAYGALGFVATSHSHDASLPATPPQFDVTMTTIAPHVNSVAYSFPSNLRLPYTFQWNVAAEKALGKHQTLTLSYVGATGHRLLQPERRDVSQENPPFSEIVFFPAGTTSSYQSVQAKFQRSLSAGLDVLASYVWSHTLDFGSTDPAFPFRYGNSDLDIRHNLQAAVSWTQPKVAGGRIRRNALNGWGIDGRASLRTGYPVTPLGNLLLDP